MYLTLEKLKSKSSLSYGYSEVVLGNTFLLWQEKGHPDFSLALCQNGSNPLKC